MQKIRVLLFSALFSALALPAQAGESPFGFIYTTDLLPEDKVEFEQRITGQDGQAHGRYNNVFFRSELEYGVTDNLQAALYFNYDYTSAKNNDVNHKTTAELIPPSHNPDESYSDWRYRSNALELIYRILSPYKDPFGLAVYFEPYYGKGIKEYEGRIILQKNFLDDRLVFAGNIVAEYEKEFFPGAYGADGTDDEQNAAWAKMVKFDIYTGVSYRFASNWSAGWEYRLHNDFDGHRLTRSKRTQLAHFTGPTLHYGGRKHFWTLALLYQVAATGLNDAERANVYRGKMTGDHANIEALRLTYGYFF